MKNLIKRLVLGTPFEPLARAVHAAIAPPSQNERYDVQTLEVMKRALQERSNCVDVGCHQGSILKEMLRLAPEGQHFAFEPIPRLYQGLQASFENVGNVHIHECALSDAAGTTTFQHVVSNPGYSGLRRRPYDRPNERIEEIQVRTERLDDVIPEDVPIHFIKIDVEGGEVQVLRGAVETIRRVRPVVVFEHGSAAAQSYGAGPDDVHDILVSRCGLRIFLMADWLKSGGSEPLSQQEFREQVASGTNYYFMAAP